MEYFYQWEKLMNQSKNSKNLNNWQSEFGYKILERDKNNFAKKVLFQVLIDNKNIDIYIIGDFNNWENNIEKLKKFKLKKDENSIFANIILENIKHKSAYKYLIVDKKTQKKQIFTDPAGVYFDDTGNSIFWDFENKNAYKQKYDFIDNFNRSIKILQTDLPGLIVHFANKKSSNFKKNICANQIKQKDYYKFIAESGVIDEIKNLGFNTVQFLPFAQSIDGDNWKFRYLVPFQFAIQKNWGNPDDFAYMIDMFHKAGIGIIADAVVGHLPYKDYKVFGQDCKNYGLVSWKKSNQELLYLKDKTPWGTMRLDYDNKFIRNFFISSCIHFLKYYKIDGFRIDNVDGIIRFGDNGDGDERENGRVFLRELNQEIYSYNPFALIDFEAHYYYEDNAKMLVAPINSDNRALGSTAYNSSRLTYFFHTEYMFKASDQISVWKFKHIAEEKQWGKSNSTVADFHNHDAAAGLMQMRCTGAYAYNCMTDKKPENHIHAIGKIKVMEAIISFCCEGRTLDLVQTFLLQSGTFEHNSSIEWFLTFNEVSCNLLNFKKRINQILDFESFWPKNVENREFLNMDDSNKVLVVQRSAKLKNADFENFVVVINTSSFKILDYKVGVKSSCDYEVIFNSDKFEFSGQGLMSLPNILKNKKSQNFELLDREVVISTLAPYGILVLKEIKK